MDGQTEQTVVVAYDSRQTCGQFQYYAEPCAQMKSETFFFLSSPGNVWSCETIAFHVTNIVGPLRRGYFSQFMSSFTSPLRRPKIKFYGGYRPVDYTLARMTLWPERHFGQCHFGWWQFGQWHFGQSDTLARDTLARVTLWPVFLASFGVPKGE